MSRFAKSLKTAIHLLDKINKFLVILDALCIVFLMIATAYTVVARYAFNYHIKGLFEITEYALVLVPFLGAAWLLKKQGHVSVDVLVNLLRKKQRTFLNMATSIICAALCAILTYYGADITLRLFQSGYRITGEIAVPQWLVVIIIPIGFFFVTLTYFSLIIQNLYKMIHKQF